ncbi:hypothetical protein L6452_17672 [Arctium lappa]|uniref:Uncharacterized protein n=1 Tax=Arctium lappa TaxID=4217 RepID=A0ACB9C445_ARCLA|nr:hypothetical protein L6452_17672 [Arctium lappa]
MPLSEFDHEEKGDALYAMELALSLEKLINEELLNLHERTMPFALDISSDDDDEPSPSNGTKNLAGGKRPKSETAVINPSKKVET